jgi:hypothetical protein
VKRLGLLAIVLGLLTLGPGPARGADAPAVVDVSWWTRLPSQSAPAGGFEIGTAPDGPTSVAAVHLDVTAAGSSGTRLQLTESGTSVGGQAAAIRVCVTVASWQAAQGGALADAPASTCGAAGADLIRDADGVWTVGLDSLLGGETGVVGLVIVPGAAQAPAFNLQLAPPSFTGASKAAGGSDAPVTAVEPSPVDTGASDTVVGAVTGSDYQPVVVPDQAPTQAPSAPSAVYGPVVAGDRAAVPLRITPSSHSHGHPYGKLALYALISLAVGTLAGGGRQIRSRREAAAQTA